MQNALSEITPGSRTLSPTVTQTPWRANQHPLPCSQVQSLTTMPLLLAGIKGPNLIQTTAYAMANQWVMDRDLNQTHGNRCRRAQCILTFNTPGICFSSAVTICFSFAVSAAIDHMTSTQARACSATSDVRRDTLYGISTAVKTATIDLWAIAQPSLVTRNTQGNKHEHETIMAE